jgi:hypothetical protein
MRLKQLSCDGRMEEREGIACVGVFASLLTFRVRQPPAPASLLAIRGATIIERTFMDPEIGYS